VIGHDWGAVFAYCYAAQYRGEVAALGIFEMALPGLGLMEQAFIPKAGGDFLWHLPFQSVDTSNHIAQWTERVVPVN